MITINFPPGWHRTQSGHYNEWRSPDGMSNFRVTPMRASKEFRGPNGADAVLSEFVRAGARVPTNPHVRVATVSVCNGTEKAYRVDDPMGLGSRGFMLIIPGTISTGLINYEILPGYKRDPAILAMINALCWP